jgi:hypothetical protein
LPPNGFARSKPVPAGRDKQPISGRPYGRPVTRYTFVVQVHPDGLSTLENLSTHERIQVSDLATVGPQIEEWLGRLTTAAAVTPEGDRDA